MKNLITILVLVVTAIGARAQFSSSPPAFGRVLSNTAPFRIEGLMKSNISINAAQIIPVGANGVQLWAHAGTTNALAVTNSTVVFEIVGPRSTNGLPSPLLTWVLAVTNRSQTNFTTAYVGGTPNQLAAASGIRLLYFTNHNSESIWLTNLDWSAR